MRKSLLLWACFLPSLFITKIQAQDIHFSQHWMTPLIQNPSMAGSEENIRAILNYRDQWRSIGTPYKTFNVSVDMALSKITNKTGFWAAGINVFNDKAGESEMGTTQANLSAAYHIFLGENSTLGAGLMAGFAQRSINMDKLKWGSQFDGYSYNSSLPGGEQAESEKISYADLGGGIVWNYSKGEKYMTGNDQRKATLGIAVFHPHKPDYSFYDSGEKLNMKIVLHGDMLIGLPNTPLSVLPGFIYYKQGKLNQLNAGAMVRYLIKEESNYTGFEKGRAFSLGAHFRAKDAFIASMLLELGTFDFGVSYDFNVSALENASSGRGGFEVAIRYTVANPLRKGSATRY
jgi:type IX secretion system PorP/SprF family membrane protein